MVCHNCQAQARKAGRDRYGRQRFKCRVCRRYSTEPRTSPLGDMRLPTEKALLVLNLLAEGSSARSISRVTGVHKSTILKLLVQVGEQCARLLENQIQGFQAGHVEIDELWTYIQAKQRTCARKGLDLEFGDSYTFLGIDETSKLLISWHVGRRTVEDAHDFLRKLARATDGRFQLSSDQWQGYLSTVDYQLGARVDYAQIRKEFANAAGEEARRYAPPRLLSMEKVLVSGSPDGARASTSHVERANWTVRTDLRRFTRLSNGFSRRRRNLRAAVALWACYYNFCKTHTTVRMPPAMKAGITSRPWKMADLLEAAAAS